ncbi:MAG: branched-chain amino acid aminotransferase [Pedobacter sp.]|nr:MAG: branched-chain amino acid aminotransferase [Pedobacter sp.]
MNTIKNISITKVKSTRVNQLDFSRLPFGKVFTDHMFTADYLNDEWQSCQIIPYGPLALSPAISVLHYGQTVFEGLKAYKQIDGSIGIFRPDKHFHRLNQSAQRMAMPAIPWELFIESLATFVHTEREWVPQGEGYSLYIRPVMFATEPALGVRASNEYKLVLLANPTGPYYNSPLKVRIETEFTRADAGGVGFAKTGGNYARSLYPFQKAALAGFDQLIWTDAASKTYVEEAGTANLVFVIAGEIITPSLGNTVLDGVTRDSILHLASAMGIPVQERKVSIDEIIGAIEDGTLSEAFAVGTGATLTPIGEITHQDTSHHIGKGHPQVISKLIAEKLNAIRYGRCNDEFGWIYRL